MNLPRSRRWLVVWLALAPSAAAAQIPLGPEFRVNAYTTGNQAQASVGCGGGQCVMVWNSYAQDGSRGGIFARRYNAEGVPVGAEMQVNSYTSEAQHTPDVAVDQNGRFMVVWNSRDHPDGQDYLQGTGLFARSFAADGTPYLPEFPVNSYTTGLQGPGRIASYADGLFVVVWTDYFQYQSQYQTRVFARLFDISGAGPAEGPMTNGRSADVASNGTNGRFVIVWTGFYGGAEVFALPFEFGGAAAPPFRVNSYTTGSQLRPAVAVDGNGDFVVVWEDANYSGTRTVSGRRFVGVDQPYGPEFQVNLHTTGEHGYPRVAAAEDGTFAVTWTSDGADGGPAGIVARSFEATTAGGPEFRVNAETAGPQRAPAIASTAASRFVVNWARGDGSGYGVFAQRFGGGLSADPIFADGFNGGP
jgi:hypothetical protein